MLELKKITKTYEIAGQNQKALDKVDIAFRKNEFVSILGQSGSGKTTMLNIIGGLDKYTSGDLIINGISTKKFNDRDWDTYRNHRVGFVFQSYNLIPHQTALQNVELALTLSGIGKEERRKRAKNVLKKVGLEKHMNKKPNQMSGGQMQRIAIARALINDPDILLADEPTGALDSETSIQVMNLLKEIAEEKLVIMVTHNPDLAYEYSTRIVKLFDGKIIDDSDPYEEKEEKEEKEEPTKKKNKKTSMNYKTALSLSLNNLMTKKGRTILTAFAGSIGIIGIALILSLSHGINLYIEKTEKETLGQYPLMIKKESVDMSTMLESFMSNDETEYDDDLIHEKNIMGQMFESISSDVKSNDLKSLKEYFESDKTSIKDYVTEIDYGFNLTLNLYKSDTNDITRVNPTTVMDALGMGTSNISSVYSEYMSNYDVFYKLMDNQEFNEQQYNLVAGEWPKNYNEAVIILNENNELSDYTLYSLGILSQDELKQKFMDMTSGKTVEFEKHTYKNEDLLGLEFKYLLNTDYYKKVNGIWVDMSKDDKYMRDKIEKAESIKIVGIIKPDPEAIVNIVTGLVGYKSSLYDHVIDKINDSEIAKEQLENPSINVFTGKEFNTSKEFDYGNLTQEQMHELSKMSDEEKMAYAQTIAQNSASTYENNLQILGIKTIDNPDIINIYPKDFDSKKVITDIIDEYNKDKSEDEKIQYTDVVGVMMSSVSTIVNVISSVLIAFVAISLIVSSIMIAIITYISVIERTKEIGILRAIGASKKDISRVFNAETLIEGLCAGILGIGVTLLLNIPANIIIKKVTDISNICVLPVDGAIILIIISVLLTVIAGFIPAKLASKKDPVIALRTE